MLKYLSRRKTDVAHRLFSELIPDLERITVTFICQTLLLKLTIKGEKIPESHLNVTLEGSLEKWSQCKPTLEHAVTVVFLLFKTLLCVSVYVCAHVCFFLKYNTCIEKNPTHFKV